MSQYIIKDYSPGLVSGVSYLRTLEEKGSLAGEYVRCSNTLVNREMQIKQYMTLLLLDGQSLVNWIMPSVGNPFFTRLTSLMQAL